VKKKRKIRKHVDPYREAQAKQRRAANMARQEFLRQQAESSLGDPVRSRPTPFVESIEPNAPIDHLQEHYLNYLVKPSDLSSSLERSKWLATPRLPSGEEFENQIREEKFAADHANATKAVSLITSLENASQKDKTRINIQRCIAEFGRHNTDSILPPKPASTQILPAADPALADIPKRAGPDTGSSEVQIAVLTAKINVLATNLHKKDKVNKRNLRLLVHKRQKHLSYLRRQDRGGPRWMNVVEKLGINDAMWKGEISL
jgi:ribosomal protein S15